MKKVDFNKLQAGDLVKVPRTQFAPMRSGWNGWLFSEAVVIRKGVGRKSKRNVVVVEMRTPAGKNNYGTVEATFYAENVFTTPAVKNLLQQERKITCGKQTLWEQRKAQRLKRGLQQCRKRQQQWKVYKTGKERGVAWAAP